MGGKKNVGENSKKAAGQARVCSFIFSFSFFPFFLFSLQPRPRFRATLYLRSARVM